MTTVDLSEISGEAAKLDAGDAGGARRSSTRSRAYAAAAGVPAEKLVLMAKLGVVHHDWMEANALHATAIQCWTSMQQNFGFNVCTLMSMMSEQVHALAPAKST